MGLNTKNKPLWEKGWGWFLVALFFWIFFAEPQIHHSKCHSDPVTNHECFEEYTTDQWDEYLTSTSPEVE